MVKAGIFDKQGIHWAFNRGSDPFGVNNPVKRIYWGTLYRTRLEAAATTCTINLGGGTWGFSAIEFCRVMSRVARGGAQGTVEINNFTGPTLFLSASLGVADHRVEIYGR